MIFFSYKSFLIVFIYFLITVLNNNYKKIKNKIQHIKNIFKT